MSLITLSTLSLLILLHLSLTSPSYAVNNASSPAAACKSSLYPKLCRSILSPITRSRTPPSNPYEYGRFSVKQCLKQARKTTAIINKLLSKGRSTLHHVDASGALNDCRQLSDLNAEYLETISSELGPAGPPTRPGSDRVRTLLSAILTNQQTCYDGLEASRSRGGSLGELYDPVFVNASRLYSVSLGLVTTALDGAAKGRSRPAVDRTRSGSGSAGSSGPMTMFSMIKRGLLEPTSDAVRVNANFTTINDAVAFAPNNTDISDGYFVIFVKEGVYQEYVLVPKNKKNLMLVGDGMNRTIVTGNHSVVDGWTTYNSATFAVHGERFVAMDMTFENTAGPQKHQAVAVRNSADLSIFYRCSFLGYQDTLYAHSLRQFYRECHVYGTVDFIFGNAASVFQGCTLYARKPMPGQKNAFTAQGRTDPNQVTGISIQNCTITGAMDLAMDPNGTENYLGRPWKEYSRTVYMQSFIDGLIQGAGWLEWNETFALDTLFFGEYNNYGPGANVSRRVQWPGYTVMNVTQALNFTAENFTTADTWLPFADIPYTGGLQ
ncbi:putative pectinesterase/pectinesterase inhibitor 25 [Acorus calamus]|uniref:Pectinesterase n=1 Tax=Acorus calamus TaxID=4465 RepID=A0AAV9E858_ACOCL|nr:putative pectinesterase/pectinesterase inhibitor 25 [Acorus calamus]